MPLPANSTSPKPCKRGHIDGRGTHGQCPRCQRIRADKYRANRVERVMFRAARRRAAENGVPFTILVTDVSIPKFCPLLGIEIERGGTVRASSPSLDRIRPELGYVPGNVWVISYRANTIKSDATLFELEMLVINLAGKLEA